MIIHATTEEEFFKKLEQILTRVISSSNQPQQVESSKLFCEQEAADILRISKETLARKRKAGLITYIDNGGRPFYKQEHLDSYLREVRLKHARN